MIPVTRLNHTSLVLNSDLIECIEVTPDTVISLTTGQKLVVLESATEVVRRVVEFRRAIFGGLLDNLRPPAGPAVDPGPRDGNPTEHGTENRS